MYCVGPSRGAPPRPSWWKLYVAVAPGLALVVLAERTVPGGIGRIAMQVVGAVVLCAGMADVMTPVPVTIDAAMSVNEAVRLMLEYRVSGLPVMRRGLVVGVLTQADLLVRLMARDHRSWWAVFLNPERLARECQQTKGTTVGEVMSRPAVVAAADDPLEMAARFLREYRIGRLPLLDHGRLVGIVTHSDVLRQLLGP